MGQPVLAYDSLPQAQREIVDAAIQDEYVECMPPSDELSNFLGRVRNEIYNQGYSGSTPTVHIRTDGTFYYLEILEEDKYISRN